VTPGSGIELRNIPVEWDDAPNRTNDGLIGTWVFYHLLTTFDYAGRSLILRRRTPETARKVREDAIRAGARPLPLWLALDHNLLSTGGGVLEHHDALGRVVVDGQVKAAK
jgi:hypothetical protein